MSALHTGLDGFVWEVRERVLALRGFDPGIDLLPGVPTGARKMSRLGEMMRHVGPTVDWPSLGVVLRQAMYGEGIHANLSKRDQNDFHNRISNAVVVTMDTMRGDFPPPPDEALGMALGWAFEGVVVDEVPQRKVGDE